MSTDLPARQPDRRVRRHDERAEAAARAGGLPDGRDDHGGRGDPPAPHLRAAPRGRRKVHRLSSP